MVEQDQQRRSRHREGDTKGEYIEQVIVLPMEPKVDPSISPPHFHLIAQATMSGYFPRSVFGWGNASRMNAIPIRCTEGDALCADGP
jgi:hypothetical protein